MSWLPDLCQSSHAGTAGDSPALSCSGVLKASWSRLHRAPSRAWLHARPQPQPQPQHSHTGAARHGSLHTGWVLVGVSHFCVIRTSGKKIKIKRPKMSKKICIIVVLSCFADVKLRTSKPKLDCHLKRTLSCIAAWYIYIMNK